MEATECEIRKVKNPGDASFGTWDPECLESFAIGRAMGRGINMQADVI